MERSKLSHKMAAAATMGAIAASSDSAMAGSNFSTLSNNIVGSTANFTDLISLLCYIGGAGLSVAGLYKLKMHVDSPSQHAMKDALIRIGVGGGLLSAPAVMSMAMGTTTDGVTNSVNPENVKLGVFNGG